MAEFGKLLVRFWLKFSMERSFLLQNRRNCFDPLA